MCFIDRTICSTLDIFFSETSARLVVQPWCLLFTNAWAATTSANCPEFAVLGKSPLRLKACSYCSSLLTGGIWCYFLQPCGVQTRLHVWRPQLHTLPAVWMTKFSSTLKFHYLPKPEVFWRKKHCGSCVITLVLFPSCGMLHPVFKMILWKTISNRGFLSSVPTRGAENQPRKEFPVRKCSAQLSLAWLRPLQRGCANFGMGQKGHSVNVWPGALETELLCA